jgi:regulator of sigma E protease
MQFLETLFYFIVTLGVLVFVHELGHFLAAKLCGMRVERFSIGFPPRAFGKKIGETDYCVSWIPIGGYVKIAGMIDESFDTEHLDRPPEPWEYRSKPMWQRMLVISGGVLMNILLAIAIFWGVNYSKGKMLHQTTRIGAVASESPAERLGLIPGDSVVAVNGKQVGSWEDLLNEIYVESLGADLSLKIVRDVQQMDLNIARTEIPNLNETDFGILLPYTEVVIQQVEPGKPAATLGLEPGDIIVALNDTPVFYNTTVIEIVGAHKGKPLNVAWTRDGNRMEGATVPSDEGRIGVSLGIRYNGPKQVISYSLIEAFPAGLADFAWVTVRSVEQVWLIIAGELSITKNVGGPVKIAQFATQSAELGVPTFFGFMAVLSISLAILNILPIPALDGGHLMFLFYEAIFRREIPVKVKLGMQKAGFALLIGFMMFVIYNDIVGF